MRNFAFASALALATIVSLPNFTVTAQADDFNSFGSEHLAQIDIGRVKSMLHLTAAQERYWAPVETALRSLAQRQPADASEGFVHRIGRRVVAVVLDSAAVERLAVSARPLIAVLDDNQKRTAMMMAQQMGLGPVLAALN